MSTPQHKGKIKNVRKSNGGYAYDRVAPGVTLPSENLTDEQLRAMSGEVIIYKKGEQPVR